MSFLRLLGLGKKPETVIKQISVDEAHQQVKDGAVVLSDVRRPEEWEEAGRPQGSYGVTLQDPEFLEKTLALLGGDYAKPVAVSCRSGGRSSQAAERLKAAGHKDIANVAGGFLAWQDAELPIDRGPFDA